MGYAIGLLSNPLAGAPPLQALQEGAAILCQAKLVVVRTEREYDYLSAVALLYVALLYKDIETTDHRTRVLAYEQAMEHLAAHYPDDAEATIFYALAFISTAPPTEAEALHVLKVLGMAKRLRRDHGYAEEPANVFSFPASF